MTESTTELDRLETALEAETQRAEAAEAEQQLLQCELEACQRELDRLRRAAGGGDATNGDVESIHA